MSLLNDSPYSFLAEGDVEIVRVLALHSMLIVSRWKELWLPHAAVGVLASPRSHCPIIYHAHGEAWSACGEKREREVQPLGRSSTPPARFLHLRQQIDIVDAFDVPVIYIEPVRVAN